MSLARDLFVVPCLALTAGTFLAACGADDTLDARAEPAAFLRPLTADPDEPSAECQAIQDQLAQDSALLQQTAQFKALEQTPAYKALMDDMQQLEQNNCSLTPNPSATGVCARLQRQAMRHRMALARTKEFRALSLTAEFKAVAQDVNEAIGKGCLQGRTAVTDLFALGL
ncbi:MAG TPA: hypothetical protein VFH51_07715 [Myxococcota bacterium]|nr:hypothetical protein [Myxococcota bacterium]